MDEARAIQQMKRGDIHGLEFLVGKYQVKAVRAAYLITQDVQLAEDVVQDVFLRIYQRIHQFDESKPFAPWFFRSVCNEAIKLSQRRERYLSMDADMPETMALMERLADMAPLPESSIEHAEQKQAVRDGIRRLPPRQRAAVVQRYYLGMSEKAMAEELGSPLGTVKWLLSDARRRLRFFLGSTRH